MIEDIEFMAPQAKIILGPWLARKVHKVQVISSRVNPIDLASVEIPIEGVALDAIAKNMEIQIFLGYREYGVWPVFSGFVDDVSWGPKVYIKAKDGMEKLRSTPIVQTFVDTQPREVMRYSLDKAGVTDYQISEQLQSLRHYFVVPGINVLQVQKLLNETWKLKWEFYREPEGTVIYKPLEETERYRGGQPVCRLEYGKNLFDLETSDYKTGRLRTFLLPMLRHGHVIELVDRRFWATETKVIIQRILEHFGEDGAGMVIEWAKLPTT